MGSGPDNSLLTALAALAAPGAGLQAADLEVLRDGPDATVVRAGDAVLKVHAPGAHRASLEAQLRVAMALPDVLLAPTTESVQSCEGRLVTRWPHAAPLAVDEAGVPWAGAGTLLARLHLAEVGAIDRTRELPAGGGPAKMLRTVERLRRAPSTGARGVVLDAFAALPAAALRHSSDRHLVHGDFHLGQLVDVAEIGLRLIDVDDLGRGDPAWDLARPAAWYAAGLMPGAAWHSFLSAYVAAGGPAVRADDPWQALDAPAQALVVQSAAQVVVKGTREADFDAADLALIEACERIARAAGGERS